MSGEQTITADGTTFFFDATPVGGIEDYTYFDGVTPDVQHRPMAKKDPEYLPGRPEYGMIRLRMYRNPADPGQQRMELARAERRTVACAIRLIDGSIRQFRGYVKTLPLLGGNINGTGIVTVTVKVAGPPS